MECSRVLDKSSKTIQYIRVMYDIFTVRVPYPVGMFHFRPQRKWDELKTAVNEILENIHSKKQREEKRDIDHFPHCSVDFNFLIFALRQVLVDLADGGIEGDLSTISP